MMAHEISIRDFIKFADIFSLANAFMGFAAIMFIFSNNLLYACILMVACALVDFMDGFIARKMHQPSEFGKMLDSLADVVSFAVAPAVFMLSYLTGPVPYVICAVFIFAGLLRLARYCVISLNEYVGMPITMNGLIFPALYFIGIYMAVPNAQMPGVFWITAIISAALMTSSIRFKKI